MIKVFPIKKATDNTDKHFKYIEDCLNSPRAQTIKQDMYGYLNYNIEIWSKAGHRLITVNLLSKNHISNLFEDDAINVKLMENVLEEYKDEGYSVHTSNSNLGQVDITW